MNKSSFIKFMCDSGVLTFGDFTLKSGRKSPYFINTGKYDNGQALYTLGEYYADLIMSEKIEFDVLFGPAYKGIPLAVSTANALFKNYGRTVGVCFDRKEAKDHGEGGNLIGTNLKDADKVLIIDDVITAGTAMRQVLPVIKSAANVEVVGVVITVDRMEKANGLGQTGDNDKSAVQEIYDEFGIRVFSIVNIEDIIEAIKSDKVHGKEYALPMEQYRKKYGV